MSSFGIQIMSLGCSFRKCTILWIILRRVCPNMQGSKVSSFTLELIDSPEVSPWKDKSYVTRSLGTNCPAGSTPTSCSTTPRGKLDKCGISLARSIGSISSHPFITSLYRALLRNSACFTADLWFPLAITCCRSRFLLCSSSSSISHLDPWSSMV